MATPQDFNTDVLKTRFDVGPAPYDDLLRKLQALGWEIQCNHASDEAILKAARHYASEEVFLLVQACRVSLNVAFNEACRSYAKNAPKVGEYPRAVEAELLAIVEEIQSLWDEVVPVAHMAVEKQLMEPILRRIDLKKESRSAQNALICHYIGGCLQFLNERLTILANRISTAVYHHQSLLIAWEHSKMSQEKPKPGAPPKVVVQEPKATAKAEGQGQTALDLIKRHMQASGLSAKVFDPLAPPSKSITKLNEFVQKRAEKGDETFQTVHQLYEAAAKSGIGENELGTRMVLDCITADSLVSYGRRGAVLQDAQTEESIVALQKESEEVDALLAKLQLPGTGQMAKVLRPMFKKALKFLDNENGAGCYHTGATAIVSCRRCQEALKQIEITQRWSELPEFKDRWN
ncbi:hypothetical protein BX600DRAFT_204882 [Xylariales sp. PMI_506]|nr:hypothetical protein BX600DRAFT_204882 [Xylariales sp. PMI_506]